MGKKNYPFFEVEISKNYPSGISTHIDWKPATNIIETEETLLIEMELPGVAKDDISITLQSNQDLVVKGVKTQPRQENRKMTYYLFEREFGSFFKKIVIDIPVDTSRIESRMENGVLIIEIPKRNSPRISVEIK
ncbi:MAG TPA: Hsp20/alpha crystallin family protein [Candidatus Aminicenantes bacterium]|nr:Hsp20/alpha crystallin family protein [Candidatus Aminicenantes bacterium]